MRPGYGVRPASRTAGGPGLSELQRYGVSVLCAQLEQGVKKDGFHRRMRGEDEIKCCSSHGRRVQVKDLWQ